jgi:hypothetical protein
MTMPRAARFDEDDDVEDPLEDLDDEDDEGDEDIDEDEAEDEAREFYGEYARPLTPDDTVDILAAAAGEPASWYRGGQIVLPTGEMTCRVCGCSDSRACEGGCFWAAPNLCSRCVA